MADHEPMAYADVPISTPMVYPEDEELSLMGFAFSNRLGITVEMTDRAEAEVRRMKEIHDPDA